MVRNFWLVCVALTTVSTVTACGSDPETAPLGQPQAGFPGFGAGTGGTGGLGGVGGTVAGSGGSLSQPDASVAVDAGARLDGSQADAATDSGAVDSGATDSGADSGTDAGTDAGCTPTTTTCELACGTILDECGGVLPCGSCPDGEMCQGNDCVAACEGCYIDGVCHGEGAPHPSDPCLACDVTRSATDWSDREGQSCDDGLFCTVSDVCSSGVCGGAARSCGDAVFCNGRESCDEDADACIAGSSTCTGGDFCDTANDSCVATCPVCSIEGACFGEGQANPTNPCEICDSATATDNWTANTGAACGDPSDTTCDAPDTCDAAGICRDNNVADSTPCGPAPGLCDLQDYCSGTGTCADAGFRSEGKGCGDPSSAACDQADTCNATGTCLQNHQPVTTTCGAAPGQCEQQDYCDGAGQCADAGFKGEGVNCGDSDDSECDNPDSCDGAGSCLNNAELGSVPCGGAPRVCQQQDYCDGTGSCEDAGDSPVGTSCGDPAQSECNGADSCDGAGACLEHHALDTRPCGGPAAECQKQDYCDGSGACAEAGSEPDTTPCNDGLFCTDGDLCSSGQCGGSALDCADGVSCNGDETCDEGSDSCLAGTSLCTGVNFCDTEADSCVSSCDDCTIDDSCVAEGQVNPLNPCQKCDKATAADDWSPNMGADCGDGADECSGQDTCDAAGICQPNHTMDGTSCGDGDDTTCTSPDSCDGAGQCQPNHAADSTVCGDMLQECSKVDYCDGAGTCQDSGYEPMGTDCGDDTDSECDLADSCDGEGSCDSHLQPDSVSCGTDPGECEEQDYCSGSGSCDDKGFKPVKTSCGDPSDTDCDDPDSCDDSGVCLSNPVAFKTPCGSKPGECEELDVCDGAGACADQGYKDPGESCGDATDTECDNPDSCDGAGLCLDNSEAQEVLCGDKPGECSIADHCSGTGDCADSGHRRDGFRCGDGSMAECDFADTCDGDGACQDNFLPSKTACGDKAGECEVQDTCDGAGSCPDAGDLRAGSPCGDSTETICDGSDTCDGSGACSTHVSRPGTDCSSCNETASCDEAGSCGLREWFVAPTGSGMLCTQADPCSLAEIGSVAVSGDTIVLSQGTYTGTGSEVLLVDRNVTILGGWDGALSCPYLRTGVTTLDGEDARRGVLITPGVVAELRKLSIVNGNASGLGGTPVGDNDAGGGLFVDDADAILWNLSLTMNSASPQANGLGGGAYINSRSGTTELHGSYFEGNSATQGGGLALRDGQASLVRDSTFLSNTAGQGGGIYARDVAVDLADLVIEANVADTGGGIHTTGAEGQILRSEVIDNQASVNGGGMYLGADGVLSVERSLISGGQAEKSAGFYLSGSDSGVDIRLINNFIVDNVGTGLSAAAVFIGSVDTATMVHNTVAGNVGQYGVQYAGAFGQTAVLRNNLVASSPYGIFYTVLSLGVVINDSNCFWDNTFGVNAGPPGIITSSAVYENTDPFAAASYDLVMGSDCVDEGNDAGTDEDYYGTVRPLGSGRDLGAHEGF